ncbi:unnamed protein product [Caenorhabditis sp. 36 PRJEB53466]|nr:unnamed protein product [Caenorhabditis sp. 36 PRJEB53466]
MVGGDLTDGEPYASTFQIDPSAATSTSPSSSEGFLSVSPELKLSRADVNLLLGVLNAVVYTDDGVQRQAHFVNFSPRRNCNTFTSSFVSSEYQGCFGDSDITQQTRPVFSKMDQDPSNLKEQTNEQSKSASPSVIINLNSIVQELRNIETGRNNRTHLVTDDDNISISTSIRNLSPLSEVFDDEPEESEASTQHESVEEELWQMPEDLPRGGQLMTAEVPIRAPPPPAPITETVLIDDDGPYYRVPGMYCIQIWRQVADSRGRTYPPLRSSPNDPLGPLRIPRIRAGPSRSGRSDQRYFEFPEGVENVEDIPPEQLIPEWYAWAGWLGPRALFRVRWGALTPVPRFLIDDIPNDGLVHFRRPFNPPRLCAHPFRCDWLPNFAPTCGRVYPTSCRAVVPSNYFSYFNSIQEETNSSDNPENAVVTNTFDMNHIVFDPLLQLPEHPTPPTGESFNMFPDPMTPPPIPSPVLFPYRGPFADLTRWQVRAACMLRCILLYLMPERTVSMDDPIGRLLTEGDRQFLRFPEQSEDYEDREIDDDLD